MPAITNNASTNKYNLLEGVALNAAESARTATVDLGKQGASRVSVSWALARTAATDVQVQPWYSVDFGATFKRLHSRTVSSGTGTNTAFTDVTTVSGNATGGHDYVVPTGATSFRVIVSGTSGGANDLIDVQVAVS